MRKVKASEVVVGDVIVFYWDADPGNPEVGPQPHMCESPFPVHSIEERGVEIEGAIRDKLQFNTANGVAGNEDESLFRRAWPDEEIEVLELGDMGECRFCGHQLNMEGCCPTHG